MGSTSVTLEKAVAHYAMTDRRVAARREIIFRHLQAVEQSGFPAAQKLNAFVRDIHLVTGLPSVRAGYIYSSFETMLSSLYKAIEGGDPEGIKAKLNWAETALLRPLMKNPDYARVKEMVDLDSYQDRVLIASMAFKNQCRLACKHCCNAGQWDEREHGLTELEAVRSKIRFPELTKVTISDHEPFTLPFLLDAVKYLLRENAGVSIVTSGLGIPLEKVRAMMSSLQALSIDHPGGVGVSLSFDLFKRYDRTVYLDHVAELLNRYPVIHKLKFYFDRANKTESLAALEHLSKIVTSPHGKEVVRNVRETPEAESTALPIGQEVEFLGDLSEAEAFLGEKTFFNPPSLFTPNVMSMMLFAGGDITPGCTTESAHFKSLGNVFQHSAEDIFARYLQFEDKYRQLVGLGIGSYPALVFAERAGRQRLGIPPHFVTHFDTLARVMLSRDRNSLAYYHKITDWVQDGLASWEGIGLSADEVAAFCDPLRFMPRYPA